MLVQQPLNKEAWEREIYQLGPETIQLSICGAEFLWDTRKSLWQRRLLQNVFWCSGYDIIVVCLLATDTKKKTFKKKKDLGSLVIWIRQKTSKSQPCSQHMCPHSYTPRQQQCFVKVTHAKNKMWCLSPKELCKLKQANQKLLVPPSKSKTYSAVVLLQLLLTDSSVTYAIIPLVLSGSDRLPWLQLRPHTATCVCTLSNTHFQNKTHEIKSERNTAAVSLSLSTADHRKTTKKVTGDETTRFLTRADITLGSALCVKYTLSTQSESLESLESTESTSSCVWASVRL